MSGTTEKRRKLNVEKEGGGTEKIARGKILLQGRAERSVSGNTDKKTSKTLELY